MTAGPVKLRPVSYADSPSTLHCYAELTRGLLPLGVSHKVSYPKRQRTIARFFCTEAYLSASLYITRSAATSVGPRGHHLYEC